MVTELDNIVYLLDDEHSTENVTVKAIRSSVVEEEWIVVEEDEFGEVNIYKLTEKELVEQYGEIPD